MNINGLMHMLGQRWLETTPQPAAARTPELQVSEQQVSEQQLSPAAIYHPAADDGSAGLPTYDSSGMEVWAFDSKTYERDDREMWDLWTTGFGATLGEMRYGYEDALAKLPPELAAKDWGFSIKNEALVIVAGDDPLSDQEIATLQKALGDLEVPAGKLASDVVRYLELDRGTDGVSKRLGRFDVSEENFDQIVDMRELLLSHVEGGKYEWKTLSSVQPNNYHRLYGMTAGYAIVDQILARADERFLATSTQRDYQTRVY